MATNPNMAKREISKRERLQKTLAAVVVYGLGATAVYVLNEGWPARFSTAFFAAVALSVVWVAFIIRFATEREDAASSKSEIKMVRMRIADDRAGRSWASRIGLNLMLLLLRAVFVAGLAVVAYGLFVFAKQLYTFATAGVWVPVSVLQLAEPYLGWLHTRDIWPPGQRLLLKTFDWLSAAFVIVMTGAAIALSGLAAMDGVRARAVARRQ